MKYKCSDCGEIFDNKPDYCDCGNNVFEEIVEESSGEIQKTQYQNIVEQSVEQWQDSVKTNNLDLKIQAKSKVPLKIIFEPIQIANFCKIIVEYITCFLILSYSSFVRCLLFNNISFGI